MVGIVIAKAFFFKWGIRFGADSTGYYRSVTRKPSALTWFLNLEGVFGRILFKFVISLCAHCKVIDDRRNVTFAFVLLVALMFMLGSQLYRVLRDL
jgi:hypothetical protein